MLRPPGGPVIAVMQFERWSLLIVGEALVRGTTRLHDFRTYLGIAPDILRARLGTSCVRASSTLSPIRPAKTSTC